MGGDHKCPVCQATFTRPQHVARHMRSHTGDRPYKCQYCGDQFARSDLLSRHINKCHASEKPLPNSTTGRRKGCVTASRATTSKQACDQCVQSSLPCDGSNPCSKCVARKCRCTYVKFHRQTAPSGPGHYPPRSPSSSSSISIGSASFSPNLDEFILAPPPSSAPPIPSSLPGSDQIFNTPFTFNPAAATAYPPNWTAADMTHLPFTMTSDADIVGKYRAQAEFLRRGGPSILSSSTPMLPGIYAAQQHPYTQAPPSSWYPAWGEPGAYPLDDTKSFDGMSRTHSFASSEPASFAPEIYGTNIIGSGYRPRRPSFDFSDSSSTTSQSMPSSASSSSIHLPLPGTEIYDARPEEVHRQAQDPQMMHHPQRRSSMPTSQPPPFSELPHPAQPQQLPRVGEGGFSNAFGLMSIDDPNVLASLPPDGVPFFSAVGVGLPPHSPNQTPMPISRLQQAHALQARERGMSSSALQTPGASREADTRELKDFWKAYMRSPLSGSGSSAALDLSAPPPPISQSQIPQSPTGQRRRVRVSSLPSVTPTVEKGHPLMNGHGGHGEGSSMRMLHHGNPEDLRSYEAAVNARSASMKLNLVPRRKGTRPSSSASPPANGGASVPDVGSSQLGKPGERVSRPSSSSSTSSLAPPFAVPPHQHQHHSHPSIPNVVKPPPMQGASISLPIPPLSSSLGHSVTFGPSTSLTYQPGSRESSVGSDGTGGTGGSGSDGEVFRPSFKRYPSQTLGPATSKRALVERVCGESVEGVKVDTAGSSRGVKKKDGASGVEGLDVDLDMDLDLDLDLESGSGTAGGVGQQSRPIAALPERAKRG